MALDAFDGTWNLPDYDFTDGKDDNTNDRTLPNKYDNHRGSLALTVKRVG